MLNFRIATLESNALTENKKVSFIKKSTSALGKLIMVVMLAATFLVGMVSVVYMSLQGEEIKVPEIVGKNFAESEKELEALGLRIKKRADRYSQENPDTVLEQLPKSGDTVKTGQMILVVVSKANPDGNESPMTIQKNQKEKDDSEKIEELIDDKPKKNTNRANTSTTNKKKATTTRDVLTNTSTNTATTNSKSTGDSGDNNPSNSNKSNPANTTTKPANTTTKQTTTKPNDSGDTRPRRTNP